MEEHYRYSNQGQYIPAFRVFVKETGLYQPRQFCLSQLQWGDIANLNQERVRSRTQTSWLVSNHMHSEIQQGEQLVSCTVWRILYWMNRVSVQSCCYGGGYYAHDGKGTSSYLNKKDALGSVVSFTVLATPFMHLSCHWWVQGKGMKVNYFYDHGANQDNGANKLADLTMFCRKILPKRLLFVWANGIHVHYMTPSFVNLVYRRRKYMQKCLVLVA